ncbi:SRPBCC family protein [Streptomyces sp. NPDC015661]|uniref:SRPBCC family protein n=1 Tax=Streptomyces sp. NPDC015661 TaxID=3364961 RepID=UPI0036FF1E9A
MEFPRFMEGVEEVRQTDNGHGHWKTKAAGAELEFDTEIVNQAPDERIAWRLVTGDVDRKGVVTFQQLDDLHVRVSLANRDDDAAVARARARDPFRRPLGGRWVNSEPPRPAGFAAHTARRGGRGHPFPCGDDVD